MSVNLIQGWYSVIYCVPRISGKTFQRCVNIAMKILGERRLYNVIPIDNKISDLVII
tara:strand:- start:2454 stop:2624 length:171 start_codon:yes stop_codon:yes gene_type:complete